MSQEMLAQGHDTKSPHHNSRKVAIIGTGQVGMAIAYAMVIENTADELILVDAITEKAEGEAMDLQHGLPYVSPITIRAGQLEDCKGVDLVIITAGAKRKPGDSRLDLMQRNAELFQKLIPPLSEYCPNAIFLVVSNPVDIMTYITWKLSGLPRNAVLGSGTILDTARFRALLGKHIGIDTRNVHAYIIGEHGDSEVAVWSRVNVAGIPLHRMVDIETLGTSWEDLATQVKVAAQEVIKRKGATCYAIGLGTARLAQAILRDQHHVMTISCPIDGPYGLQDVCLSLPSVIGRHGVHRVLDMQLDENEREKLLESAQTIRDCLTQLGF